MASIWTEKYRPQEFSEIKGQDEIVKRIEAFVKSQNVPHIMFAGPAGTGKTSLAIVAAKKLFGENWRQNFLELNASDERGIDIIRTNVKDFARTKAIGDAPFKVVYLDECDALTKEAQQALRRTMENYTNTARFFLSCNYSSKIIEPIQSRCAVFRFRPLSKENVFIIIDKIALSEGLKIDEKAKEALYELSEGDCRKLENIMQSCASITNHITEDAIYAVASSAKPKELKEVLALALANHFQESRAKLLEIMLNHGLSGLDIIRQMQKEVMGLNIDARKKLYLVDKCGEIEFRMVEGSDEFIQLEALLSQVALAGYNEGKVL